MCDFVVVTDDEVTRIGKDQGQSSKVIPTFLHLLNSSPTFSER